MYQKYMVTVIDLMGFKNKVDVQPKNTTIFLTDPDAHSFSRNYLICFI